MWPRAARARPPSARTAPRTRERGAAAHARRRHGRRRRRRRRAGASRRSSSRTGRSRGCRAAAAAGRRARRRRRGRAATLTAPAREAPLPTGNVPEPKKGAPEKHRLLALVPPEGIQRVEREQGDRINVWPHLLIEEFVAMFILLAALTIFSTFVNAPLRELANPNLTPNPSKAPWYFLGLQELLRYFHPMVAGVTIPDSSS